MVDHAVLLSDKRFHKDNIKLIKTILLNNCFPLQLINKHIKKRLIDLNNKKYDDDIDNADNDTSDDKGEGITHNTRNHIVIPYIKKH